MSVIPLFRNVRSSLIATLECKRLTKIILEKVKIKINSEENLDKISTVSFMSVLNSYYLN